MSSTGHRPLPTGHSARHGLAPLEMVLALPLLLMLMALMVNFGIVAMWKVRSLSVSRFEAWRERHESYDAWAGSYAYPRDASWWPTAATFGHESAGNVTVSSEQTAAVDPTSLVPSAGDITVVATLLDSTRGLLRGRADLSRHYPMLGKMGLYDVSAQTRIVDGKWQFNEMGLEYNSSRRYWVIYNPPSTIMSDIAAENYANAAKDLYYTFYYNAPYKDYLSPLDNDDEFIAYKGSAPDFHQALSSFCTLNKSTVDDLEQNLIDRIQGSSDGSTPGVPERMTKAFIALYKQMVQDYQSQIDSGSGTSGLESSVTELKQKINTLEKFLTKLQGKKGSG